MRCGAFGSWHWVHSPVATGLRASWVRRFDVRVLECRRFGLGIISILENLVSPMTYDDLGLRPKPLSAANGESSQPGAQSQVPVFRFVPHCTHSPRHSSPHSGFIGSAR